ncbi:MFS transporter [Enterococcus sp.]|uniref:MFS transporter n=1 Tax=Enterococcus sp. TaxID=35783 RepID=UPI002FC5FEB5
MKKFNDKNLNLLFISSFISILASFIQNTALSLYVLDLTKSSSQFAFVLSLGLIPRILISPFAGVLADWFNRKKLILTLNALNTVIVLVPVIIFRSGEYPLSAIYVISVLLSVLSSFYSPALSGVIRSITAKEKLPDVYAVKSFIDSTPALIGPLVGAALYGLLGIRMIYLLDGFGLILSSLLILGIHIPHVSKQGKKSLQMFADDFKDGCQYLFKNQTLANLALTVMFLNFFAVPLFTVGTGYLVKIHFGATDQQFALVETVGMTASFLGPVLFQLIKKKVTLEHIFQISILTNAIFVFGISLIAAQKFADYVIPYVFYLGFFFLICLFEGPLNIAILTLIQVTVDVEYAGRINGVVTTMFIGLIPLGQIFYGYLFENVPLVLPYLLSAMAYVLLVFFYRKRIKEHRLKIAYSEEAV